MNACTHAYYIGQSQQGGGDGVVFELDAGTLGNGIENVDAAAHVVLGLLEVAQPCVHIS